MKVWKNIFDVLLIVAVSMSLIMPAMAIECSVVEKVTEKEARMLAEYLLKYLSNLVTRSIFCLLKYGKEQKSEM